MRYLEGIGESRPKNGGLEESVLIIIFRFQFVKKWKEKEKVYAEIYPDFIK